MRFVTTLKKIVLSTIFAAFFGLTANAAIYTAVLSGNFNASATWGGIAPGSLLTSDVVIIPMGITVTLTADETFSGTSALTVNGTLTSAGGALIMTSGSLIGTGTITVDSMALGLTSGLTFTGDINADALTSLGASLATAADVTVNDDLRLSGGTLSLTAGSLTLGTGAVITRSGGSLSVGGSGALSLGSSYSVVYTTSGTAGVELTGSGLDDLTVGGSGTVTLSSPVTLDGMLTLTSGTLSLAGYTLTLGAGADVSASGTGTITGSATSDLIISTGASLTGALRFASGSGGMLDDLTVSAGSGSVTLGTDLSLAGMLTLSSGTLTIGSHTLTLGAGGDISASGTGTLTGSATSDLIISTGTALTGMLRFATGGAMLDDLTVAVGGSGTATLGTDLTLDGVLTLTSGTLSLAGYTLTLGSGADVAASGTGTLTGSATSDLVISTAGSLSGALRFATGSGGTLGDLTLSMGGSGSTATLGSGLTVGGTLGLNSGRIRLGANDLTISTTGMISGGASGSYVITDGTGELVMHLTAGVTDTFEIGTLTDYAPIAVIGGTGSAAADVSAHVMNGVLSSGTTGTLISATAPVVDATWDISSSVTTGINYTLVAMWDATMELNSFNRTNAYLSHYTSGSWDATATSAAGTSGSMYTMTRAGITSLSPFMVTDASAATTGLPVTQAAIGEVITYPNPVAGTLYFSGTGIDNICVYDVCGKQVKTVSGAANSVSVAELPAGTYIVRFTGENLNTVKKIVKE